MEIFVNDKIQTLNEGANIVEMLDTISLTDTIGIAIALNEMVVPRNNWTSTKLNNQDKILIIKATQGG